MISPAFAAPYAAVLGDGRIPLTLEMLTITPPSGCWFITAKARWAKTNGAIRLRLTIDVVNFGDTVAVSDGGAPPALLTSTSRRPNRSIVKVITASIWSGSRTSAVTNDATRSPTAGMASGS